MCQYHGGRSAPNGRELGSSHRIRRGCLALQMDGIFACLRRATAREEKAAAAAAAAAAVDPTSAMTSKRAVAPEVRLRTALAHTGSCCISSVRLRPIPSNSLLCAAGSGCRFEHTAEGGDSGAGGGDRQSGGDRDRRDDYGEPLRPAPGLGCVRLAGSCAPTITQVPRARMTRCLWRIEPGPL